MKAVLKACEGKKIKNIWEVEDRLKIQLEDDTIINVYGWGSDFGNGQALEYEGERAEVDQEGY